MKESLPTGQCWQLPSVTSDNYFFLKQKKKVILESDGNVLSMNTTFSDKEYDTQGKGDTIAITPGCASNS